MKSFYQGLVLATALAASSCSNEERDLASIRTAKGIAPNSAEIGAQRIITRRSDEGYGDIHTVYYDKSDDGRVDQKVVCIRNNVLGDPIQFEYDLVRSGSQRTWDTKETHPSVLTLQRRVMTAEEERTIDAEYRELIK